MQRFQKRNNKNGQVKLIWQIKLILNLVNKEQKWKFKTLFQKCTFFRFSREAMINKRHSCSNKQLSFSSMKENGKIGWSDPLVIIEKGPKYDGISEGKEISTGEVKWISFLMKPKWRHENYGNRNFMNK